MYRDTATALDERDRAVGAILIGEALVDECDRAALQLTGRNETPATERWRAVAEVQDIYPEIWRNLDRARGVLARRGANTVAYDELRPHAKRRATDGDAQQIDVEALDWAKRALAELKLSVSGVDWKAIAARTAGLARMPLGSATTRRRAMIGAGLGALLLCLFIGWILQHEPARKPTRAEVMRRELAGIREQRKVRIAFVEAGLGELCMPPLAHDLIRMMVFDGRRLDAQAFAASYTETCGGDPVIENWARAPRPSR